MKLINCPFCGTLVDENLPYCTSCLKALKNPSTEPQFETQLTQTAPAVVLTKPPMAGDSTSSVKPAAPEEIPLKENERLVTVKLGGAPVPSAAQNLQSPIETNVQPERTIVHPKTIEELKLYVKQKGMPTDKMRFFIDRDYKEPRAFGIYREGNHFVVYKNKDTGVRAIRYRGPDEEFAVNELFQKILSECNNRGIYPDKPASTAPNGRLSSREQRLRTSQWRENYEERRRQEQRRARNIACITVLCIVALLFFAFLSARRDRGYYRINDTLYYRDRDTWYSYDNAWHSVSYYMIPDDYDDYYLGYSYNSEYGSGRVQDSSAWELDHPDHSYDSDYDDDDYNSDYDDWDFDDSDWGSDW